MQPVVFIGAGPGHADYMTLKGARYLANAQVVFYDALIEFDTFEELLPAQCQKIPVGKRCGAHSKTQREISKLLVESAMAGNYTVRLKGGDPSIFGRLGEELLALYEAGIPWEIIPGVSSMNAASADFSLPLTLRNVSDCICIVNGHELHRKPVEYLHALANHPGTLVIFMGAGRHREICNALLKAGSANKPVRMIENAGRNNSKSYAFDLLTGAAFGDPRQNAGPALLLIGDSLKNVWDGKVPMAELQGMLKNEYAIAQ